ncbi:diacylglycerol kinase [Schlegelella sp. S2-27]|uniref:Diacylglycerol kinase n=1 Tax=Caldimonas mangrovi TaxID=2944811 RepID=A0ABT0YHC5_9BURK|nr:diacylglycerol kinase [Caldimonas mangrovi]
MNTHSGSGDRHRTLATLAGVFGEAGVRHEVMQVTRPKQLRTVAANAVALAAREGGTVVAAGGDGTINTVAHAVLDTELPFGVLPHGTFNYFSRTHGIPTDVEGAARTLVTGTPRPVQVGRLNERLFLVNASLGLYPRLLEEREAYKRRYGRTRWVALCSGLLTLLREHWQVLLRVEHEGEPRLLKTSTLFVGNNALQLAQIGIDDAPVVAQGQLVALSVKTGGRWAMLGLLLRGAVGRLGSADQVASFAFRHLEVEPVLRRARPVKMKVSVDGETQWMSTPLVFGVEPKPLWLIVPPAA